MCVLYTVCRHNNYNLHINNIFHFFRFFFRSYIHGLAPTVIHSKKILSEAHAYRKDLGVGYFFSSVCVPPYLKIHQVIGFCFEFLKICVQVCVQSVCVFVCVGKGILFYFGENQPVNIILKLDKKKYRSGRKWPMRLTHKYKHSHYNPHFID